MMGNNNSQGTSWLDRIDTTIIENRKLTLLLLIQLVAIILLAIGYMKLVDKLVVKVELPSAVKEQGVVVVGKEYANKTFFQMWGREDIEVISNFNHKNIDEKIDYLRTRMYPPYFYKNKQVFDNYQAKVKEDIVTQNFTFAKENILIDIDDGGKEATIEVSGFYKKIIDEDVILEAQPCDYSLSYFIEGGHIYVSSFKTTCK